MIPECLKESPSLSAEARNKLDNLYIALFGSGVFCIGIFGFIASIINLWKTPTCLYFSEAIYFWVFVTLLLHIPSSIIVYQRLKIW